VHRGAVGAGRRLFQAGSFQQAAEIIQCDAPEALRRHLEELCYEVESADRRASRQFLQTADGVLSVEPSGATLHLFLSPGRASPEDLTRALERKGLGPVVFRPIEPSLEDVFIALVRKSGAMQ